LLVLSLCLAACTPVASTPEASQVDSSAVTSAEGSSESVLAPQSVLLPERFVGRWDANLQACKTTSDMKLTLTQTDLIFWESSGHITAVALNAPEDVTVKAVFTGEGEQWSRDLHMISSGDGGTLILDGAPRVRCPN